jgi:glycosyltransferase involved in cell wall biosynthesis
VATAQPDSRRPGALLIVRNTFEHDARVLRAARTLERLSFDVTVLAARGASGAPAAETRGGVRVIRVGTSSELMRRFYRRLTGQRARRTSDAAPPTADDAGMDAAERRRRPGVFLLAALVRWVSTADFYARGIATARRLRPELVQCNDYNTVWIGVAMRLFGGSALVYDSHELWPDRALRPEARWWLLACEALFVRVAHRVVMTSPAHAEVVAHRYRVPEPVVVRNIPEQPPDGVPRPSRDGAAGPTAIYVGAIHRHRGIEQTIRALPSVESVRLRLLGPVADGYRAELEALASEYGVRDRVEFAPPVPPTDVVAALASADVGLVLFQPISLNHKLLLPNKLFEYVRAGLPVVGSDLPMITRFVRDHDVGATVDPEDPGAIAAALATVTETGRHEELRAAAERAGRTFDWRSERELLAGVYRDALARARS